MAQINILPAAAQVGGCSATYESYYTGTGNIGFGPQGSQYQYTNYQLTATAADGWAVDRIVYHYSWTASDGTSGTDTTTTRNISTNPFLQPENKVYTTYEYPGDFQKISGGDWSVHTTSRTITAVDVYFKTGPTPPPGVHNVSATSNPSQGGEVQVGSGERGTHSVDAVAVGGSVALTAYPAQGWALDGWYENGSKISESATLALSNVTTDRTLEARFKEVCHITVVAFKSSGRVTLNGAAGVVGSSAYVVAEADIPQGDSVTIGAISLNPSVSPFKAWYLNPSAWGNPEGTGTLVPGAGATYTFTASADATYFATFTSPVRIEVRTEDGVQSSQEAPAAVVSINGQSAGGNRYELDVPSGSSVTVEASDYGGVVDDDRLGDVRLYFEGWRPDYDAIIVSTDLRYTFQAVGMSYRYMGAVYSRYVEIPTVVMPDASTGSISTTPTAKDGSWFEAYTDVTLRARPSPGYTFIKWTLWKKSISGQETETFVTDNEQITIRAGKDFETLAPTYAYRAYFGRTHLLVNSFDRSTPVQLVYDPATNLLVADY